MLTSGRRAQKLRELGDLRRIAHRVDIVFLDISKSNLLYRLLYCGEKLREEMCPKHKGEWNDQAMLDGCEHNCHGTGWLSSVPVDKSVTPIMIATVRDVTPEQDAARERVLAYLGSAADVTPEEERAMLAECAPVESPDPAKT